MNLKKKKGVYHPHRLNVHENHPKEEGLRYFHQSFFFFIIKKIETSKETFRENICTLDKKSYFGEQMNILNFPNRKFSVILEIALWTIICSILNNFHSNFLFCKNQECACKTCYYRWANVFCNKKGLGTLNWSYESVFKFLGLGATFDESAGILRLFNFYKASWSWTTSFFTYFGDFLILTKFDDYTQILLKIIFIFTDHFASKFDACEVI